MLQPRHGIWFLVWVMSYRKTGSLGLDCINRLQTSGHPGPFPPSQPLSGSRSWLSSSSRSFSLGTSCFSHTFGSFLLCRHPGCPKCPLGVSCLSVSESMVDQCPKLPAAGVPGLRVPCSHWAGDIVSRGCWSYVGARYPLLPLPRKLGFHLFPLP